MKRFKYRIPGTGCFLAVILLLFTATGAVAAIDGLNGNTFTLTAMPGNIQAPDTSSIPIWGWASDGVTVQYPGPTLIVPQGSTVTVTLENTLGVPTSIVFPGQVMLTESGDAAGALTAEAAAGGGTATYSFIASQPGTYTYYSGTDVDLQAEMGLIGVLIVRPTGYSDADPATWNAYGDARSAYDNETLFLLTEMDPEIHQQVAFGFPSDTTTWWPTIWFMNGRAAPDTLADAGVPWLPNQPYNCFPMTHPGERTLLRMVGGGRAGHPHHTHGNNFEQIARDGRLLESAPAASTLLVAGTPAFGTVPDQAVSDFTMATYPGATYDMIFTWTGQELGWDPYGEIDATCTDADNDGMDDGDPSMACHDATCTDVSPADGFDDATHEYCGNHGDPFPVILPGPQDLTFGQFYSGGPFLGMAGSLPPGEGGFNPTSGFFYMWHSHNEKELTNNDIFPGGMLSLVVIVPFGTPLP